MRSDGISLWIADTQGGKHLNDGGLSNAAGDRLVKFGFTFGSLLLFGAKAFQADHLAGEFGKAIDDGRKFFGVLLQRFRKGVRIEAVEQIKELDGGEVKRGLLEFGGVRAAGDLDGVGRLEFHLFEPLAMLEPVFIAALFPIAEILGIDSRVAGLGEIIDDVRVIHAVIKEFIHAVADIFGKTGDFACAPVVHRGKRDA